MNPTIVRQQIANLRLAFPELEADEETWFLALESETDINALLGRIVDHMDDVTVMLGGLNNKLVEFEDRLNRYVYKRDALRKVALELMQAANVQKMEFPTATLSIRKGSPRVTINDEASVPDDLCKITRSPDKAKIKEALQYGATFNWATLEIGEPSLTVKTK